MADKKNAKATTDTGIDISKFLPEGFEADGLVTVGGLRNICPAEVTYEQKSPIAGYIVTVMDMPLRESLNRKGEKEPWQAIIVRLTHATKGLEGEDVVTIEAGKDVLVPVNGSLRNNADLLRAASDSDSVFFGVFQVTGKIETGKPTPMWNYEVQIHKKTVARTGSFAIYNRPVFASANGARLLPGGNMFDAKTGEVASA